MSQAAVFATVNCKIRGLMSEIPPVRVDTAEAFVVACQRLFLASSVHAFEEHRTLSLY